MTFDHREFDAGVRLAQRRADIERELVGHLLRNRRRGVTLANAAGVTPDCFDQPDLRAIYIAIRFTVDRDAFTTLLAAKFVLTSLGFWDEAVPRGSRGMFWSSETLVEMEYEGRDPPCPALVPTLIGELLNHCRIAAIPARSEAA